MAHSSYSGFAWHPGASFLAAPSASSFLASWWIAFRSPTNCRPGFLSMPRSSNLSVAFSTYARAPKVLGAAFALSIIPAHLCNFLAFFFTARAFDVFHGCKGADRYVCVLPIVTTIASMPISLSGVGVREGLFQNISRHALWHTRGHRG